MEKCASTAFGQHNEYSEQTQNMRESGNETFSERKSSIRVTVRNVYLISYLLMHVETEILLMLLRKCMLLCFIWTVLFGSSAVLSLFQPHSPLRGVGILNNEGLRWWKLVLHLLVDLLVLYLTSPAAVIEGIIDTGRPF